MTARNVDNAQAAMTECGMVIDEIPEIVGPAMLDDIRHPPQDRFGARGRRDRHEASNPTHIDQCNLQSAGSGSICPTQEHIDESRLFVELNERTLGRFGYQSVATKQSCGAALCITRQLGESSSTFGSFAETEVMLYTTQKRIHLKLNASARAVSAALLMQAAVPLICWGQGIPPSHVDSFDGHPRLIVISDIGNEPDDQMSLTRLLLYSNELDIEALIAATSTWQKNATHPETMRALIRAYGQVRPNLVQHATGWPTSEELDTRVYNGQPGYGMTATGVDRTSEGAQAIIKTADRNDKRPLWITIWGGANTLAQALSHVRATRTPEELDKFVAKLRVSSISDQDDAGPWIRKEFPNLFYIVQPSTPTGGEYYYATWTGISGDIYYRNCAGADSRLVTNEWLDANIRSKGPLGRLYPRFLFIMEGDTPSYLGLIDNGLAAYFRPDWGGWGGRYIFRQLYGEKHGIWTQGGDLFSRVTSQDEVTGVDGQQYISDQATIWRWREAYQNDFAARMDWTINDYKHSNHSPLLTVNGNRGTGPIYLDVKVGQPLILDASGSYDPDGQLIHYRWFHYPEAGSTEATLAAITIAGSDTAKAVVTATATCRPGWLNQGRACPPEGVGHVILAATDDGTPKLTSYRRVILRVHGDAAK